MAGGIRFARLAVPPDFVFDETYYAKDACLYLGHDQEFCESPHETEQSYVHPPLGKWLIAIGINSLGYNSLGWRAAAALFGTALVPLVYFLARKLFRDRWIATVAGLLTATDFLLIVQSRTAMLDIFLAFFVVLGFLFLAFDRDRILLMRENALLPFHGETPRREPEWRVLAGVAFGLALATKWSAVWAIVAAAGLSLAWSYRLAAQLRTDEDSFIGADPFLVREIGRTVLAFILVPVFLYFGSYANWFATNGFDLGEFVELHRRILDFHTKLGAQHAYQAEAITWPFVIRPVAYFWEGEPKASHILAFGNPAIWWPALLAAVWMVLRSFRRWRPERFILVAWFVQYGAWLLLTSEGISNYLDQILFLMFLLVGVPWTVYIFMKNFSKMRTWGGRDIAICAVYLFVLLVGIPLALFYLPFPSSSGRAAIFFFYMTPIAPFMMIGLAAALGALREAGAGSADAEVKRVFRLATTLYLAAAMVLVVYFYPVLTAFGLHPDSWSHRMWLRSWI